MEKEFIKKEIVPNKNVNTNISHKKLIFTKSKITGLKVIIIIRSIIVFIINFIYLFSKTEITLDNKIKVEYEDNISFSEYSTTIKPIAIYNPKNYALNNSLINNKESLYTYDINAKKLKDQINLAKNHGIYGLGFYYFWPYDNAIYNSPLDIMIENKQLDFNFFNMATRFNSLQK